MLPIAVYTVYRVVLRDDEQQTCLKHAEVNFWNKLKVKIASCWFLLYEYIMIEGQQNIKKDRELRMHTHKHNHQL